MLTEERQQIILNQLRVRKVLSVTELGSILHTSDVTIRRDLKDLADRGLLKRTHGGATYINYGSTSYEPMLSALESENTELKQAIGMEAVRLIVDNTAIFLDASSTVRMLCKEIMRREWLQLTVVTNSLEVASHLAVKDGIEVVMIGGVIRKNLMSSSGFIAENTLSQLKVDISFMGINGIDFSDMSATTPNLTECSIKQAVLRSGQRTIVLADHTKFGKSYLGKVCTLKEIDGIITDERVDPGIIAKAEEKGVLLIRAKM